MKPFFKKQILLFVLSVSAVTLAAQQNHFIYLQTENKQPFYVKLDKKLLSSSASGYLIIPKLADGTYTLTLGFPKNEWPEQKVTCAIDKKDAGFILKNFGEKGWGLFNWQSLNVVMADKKVAEQPLDVVKKEAAPAIKEQEASTQVAEVKKEEPAKQVITVTKLRSNKTADGIEMLFTDAVNGTFDTVSIFLPIITKEITPPPVIIEDPKQSEIKEERPVELPPAVTVLKEEIKKEPVIENKKEDIIQGIKKEEVTLQKSVSELQQPEPAKKVVIQNSDCKAAATDDDFIKLRKKMVAENTDDDMVAIARKSFKTKCYTVEQIKNLSVLFLNDNGRYKFFDAAYPFVSDSYNFSSLQKLLVEEYYINRFKAMLRQ